eukprot:Nitzschia sp. Nitz4//scaffold5_size260463//22619//23551//NITZ4_000941-RA/size260463-processed-gene-0.109-mRNA-1//-1//CDS//3329555217//2327//frame0
MWSTACGWSHLNFRGGVASKKDKPNRTTAQSQPRYRSSLCLTPVTDMVLVPIRGATPSRQPRGGGAIRPRIFFLAVLILLLVLVTLYGGYRTPFPETPSNTTTDNTITTHTGIYRGSESHWKEGVTLSVKTVFETPFARCQVHEVQVGQTHIDDWLWFDEYNNVNVLVQHESGMFWILEQTKYALPGKSYAVMGGMIEPNESPLESAQRELREELQLESPDWVSLGSYVAASNRGGGTTNIFWARQAKNIPGVEQHQLEGGEIAQGELERQDVVQLTKEELVKALLGGKFQEIKWTATVALALLQDAGVT